MRKSFILYTLLIVITINIVIIKCTDKKRKQNQAEVLENLQSEGLDTNSYSKPIDRMEAANNLEISRFNSITRAVEKIEPAVVSVNVIKTEVVRRYTNPFENPFFGFFDYIPYKRQVKSIGSGVVFDERGYILSNAHVVEGATKIQVVFPDGRNLDGKLIGLDSVQDIAVIKVEDKNLPVAKLGKSSDLIIGEWSIAVGNPYGFLLKDSKPSVSVGVISAVNRNFAENQEGKIYKKMIQTDAAINPGNSGGPLVNIFGEIIGINTFIFSESGGSVGVGFAIPIDRVKKTVSEIIEYGKVRDVWFGFRVQDINQMIAQYLKLKNMDGVIVTVVEQNGPAEKIGMKRGDIIYEINNVEILNTDDAELVVSDVSVGDIITLKVLRGKKKISMKIKAEERK